MSHHVVRIWYVCRRCFGGRCKKNRTRDSRIEPVFHHTREWAMMRHILNYQYWDKRNPRQDAMPRRPPRTSAVQAAESFAKYVIAESQTEDCILPKNGVCATDSPGADP